MAWTYRLAVLILMITVQVALSQDYLQYIDLGTTAGVSHVQLPIADDVNSDPIFVPYGFAFGTSIATLAYVNTNGYIIFDDDLNVYTPIPFPASTDLSLFVAPFWADIDIQSSGTGSVSYEIHSRSTSPELLSQVGGVIRQQNPGSDFAGTWMLVAEWRDVPGKFFPPDLLNTFQALVITNGYQSYSVFTYNCTDVNWGGIGASVVGFKADESYYVNHPMSYSQSVTDIDCSNTASTFVNVIYQLNQDSIREFISLGTTQSVTQVTLPSEIDAASQSITIPGGFPFGASRQATVYVVEHGYFSFGRQFIDTTPGQFPGSASYLVAPFWANHDVRGGGQVSYEVHSISSDALSLVSTFVSQQMQADFSGTWMLVAMWDGVHQFPHTSNTGMTNTYQAILVTDGGVQSYAVFIYSCSLMQWAGGATIGFNTDGGFYQNHPLSRQSIANSIACSNTPTTEWVTLVYRLAGDFLPFLVLSSPSEITNEEEAASPGLSIPGGFPLGTTTQTNVFVNSNGYMIFGILSISICCPVPFPSTSSGLDNIVAPYWSDIDITSTGQIAYQVYSSQTETMSLVSTFVSQRYGIDFTGTWMLVASWENVPQFIRSETLTNTFQGILITDGEYSFAVFTYKCGSLSWDGDATIGFNTGDIYSYHSLSGSTAEQIACLDYPGSAWTNVVYGLFEPISIPVILVSTPSGPDYPAATWIDFECSTVEGSGSGDFSYQWNVYCSSTMQLVFQSLAGSETTFRVKSTPIQCFDVVECVIFDSVNPATNSSSITISSVIGVGFFANDNPAANNTAVLADSSNQIGTLYCTSGSRDPNIGMWYSPTGTPITNSSSGALTVVYSDGGFPSYVGLQLQSGELAMSDEGVYTCVIPDENGLEQTLYAGIYRNGYSVTPAISTTGLFDTNFTVTCTSAGAPSLTTFYRDTGSIQDEVIDNAYDDASHYVIHTLVNGTSATYNSILVFEFFPSSPSELGEHACQSQTTYISSNSSETSIYSTTAIAYFGLYNVGSSISILCTDSNVDNLMWLDDTNNVLDSNSSAVLLNIAPVRDTEHERVYSCRRTTGNVVEDLKLTVIVLIPPGPILDLTVIKTPPIGVTTAGDFLTLSCFAVNTVAGLSGATELMWIFPDGTPVYNESTSIDVQLTNVFTSQAGIHTCTGVKRSPALAEGRITMSSYILEIRIPNPLVQLTVPPGPFYSTESVTFTCEAFLSSYVDEFSYIQFDWQGPQGNLSVYAGALIGTITETLPNMYTNTLTVTSLMAGDGGNYLCTVIIGASSPYVTGSNSSAAAVLLVSEPIPIVSLESSVPFVLDISPYNMLSLNCSASLPIDIMVSFQWRRSFEGVDSVLIDNGDDVIVTDNLSRSLVKESILEIVETIAGNVTYTCVVTVSATGVQSSDAISVLVKGPLPPAQPITQVASTTYQSATLQWTVPYIAYDVEVYQLQYGTNESQLDQVTSQIPGSNDLTETDASFSVQLTGLVHDTYYYYRVIANNSVGSTQSNISSFLTVPLPLSVTITPSGISLAGGIYTLTCRVTEAEDISGTPQVTWFGPNGEIVPGYHDNITLIGPTVSGSTTTLSLEFDPILFELEGVYTCQAIIGSNPPQSRSNAFTVAVGTLQLNVSITSDPPGPVYQAASPVNLTCEVLGFFRGPLASIQWSSTCAGSCFVLGQSGRELQSTAVRSTDSGIHTCTVIDALGNTGEGSTVMNVTGIGINYDGLFLSDNNEIRPSSSFPGQLSSLICASGSESPGVGQLVAPDGDIVMNTSPGLFSVSLGGVNNPGFISMVQRPGVAIDFDNGTAGVYTCLLPDENDIQRETRVGIYPFNYINNPITITSLQNIEDGTSVFTLSCSTNGSIPTAVTWRRNGVVLSENVNYQMTQVLINGVHATYNNMLQIILPLDEIPSDYSCTVENLYGDRSSDMAILSIRGLQVSDQAPLLTVGESTVLSCTTDLDASSIQWIYNDEVIVNSSGQVAYLPFDPISDFLHGRVYICRSVGRFGVQERSVQLTVLFPPDLLSLTLSLEEGATAVAGDPLAVNCTLIIPDGVSSPVDLQWIDSSGIVTTGGALIVGDQVSSGNTTILPIRFDPLRAVHENRFFCQAVVMSPAPPHNITQLAELAIIVQVFGNLGVTVSSTPRPSPDLTFQAGTPLNLFCAVTNGGMAPFSYQWMSSCGGDCFVSQQTSQTISQPILHSTDSGSYTCVATDYIGREGSDSINVTVAGVSLVLRESNATEQLLSNNSILLAPPNGRLGVIQCVSGSIVPDSGSWVAPNGENITNSDVGPFDVTTGGQSDPGFLSIEPRMGTLLDSRDEGVYTCVIPDENGITQFLHLGIYLSNFSGTPTIESIALAEDSTVLLSLSCLSSGTPAVNALWHKDFIIINFETDIYSEYQVLIDGSTATYENFLSASADPSLLVGEYTCSVSDSLGGFSQNRTIEVLGIIVSGFSTESEDLIVGEDVVLSCSSDLNSVTAEWWYRGEVVANGSGFANLEFFPVSDTLHGTQYTCRINTPHGSLEEEISLRVDVPVSSVNISITASDMPVAGYPFTLTCFVTIPEGLSGPVNLSWIGPDDETISSQGDFTVQFNGEAEVTNSTLTIDPLRTYDEGRYSCVATVMSPALRDPINASAEVFVDVEILFPLDVSIVDTVDSSRGPDYAPGTSVSLNCTVRLEFPPVAYEWLSTCSGVCFVLRQRMRSFIERDILYAADAGNHTCTAVDDIGNTGNATVEIRIIGASFYLFDQENPRTIPNNGIIFTDSSGDLPPLQCISGSLLPNAGEWITPSGQDRQFNLTYGNASDPGYFTVSGQSLTFADQGVYSCRIPDYSGNIVTIRVGLYYPLSLSGRVLNITSLREYSTIDPYFAISCTSSGLPATTVQWRKDGAIISDSIVLSTVQVLRDPLLAIYDNLLMIYLEPNDVIGTYLCIVENEVDSDQASIAFEGLRIIGNPSFTVSEATSLLCSTDLQVDYIVWLYDTNIVENATGVQQLELTFDPVSDLLHNNMYTCRAATSYGVQERNMTITVEVPSSSLAVSIYTGRDPIASEIFELTCVASVLPGVDSPVLLQWLDENGQNIQANGDITIGPRLVNGTLTTQSLVFNVLRVVHSASYRCNATLLSPALNEPLVAMAQFSLDVQTIELSVVIQQIPSNPDFTASGPLTLTCLPQLGTGNYTYLWSSNCTGNCFVENQTSVSIQRDALRSTDSGLHICTVMDDAGNTGIGSLLVRVIGAGFYLPAGTGQLPRSPIIFTSPVGSISEIWCLSGSRTPRVGRWISPDGTDITDSPTSPFRVTYGDNDNPGLLIIETPTSPLTSADEGVYTCYIPDETEVRFQSVYAGIYLSGFDILPTVTSLERDDTTLTCNTTGSPPTLLQWEKNGRPLPRNANGYRMSEVLIDGRTSTFSNYLYIDLPPGDLVGNYTCTVENALGVSNTEKIEIKGLQISGNDRTFPVSSTSSLLCTSDLDVLTIEWLYNGSVVTKSNDSTASLTFDPITDDLHNRLYVCKVTSPYGTQEVNTTVRVLVPDTVLTVSVDVEGVAEAGQVYTLICSAEKPNEVLATPMLSWIGNDGFDILSRTRNDVSIGQIAITGTVTSLALQFNLLHTSDIGQYTCVVELPSPALPIPLLRNASRTIAIQIPSPAVMIRQASSTVYAGSILALTCTIQLIPEVDAQFSVTTNWFRSGVPLVSNIRTTVTDTMQLSLLVYETELRLDPTSQSGDSGVYICEAFVTPNESVEFITGVNTSAEAEILVQIPDLNVALSPESITLLDISPYNFATLRCSASQHTSIVVIKSITWTRSFNDLTESVTHNGITRNITIENIDSAVSTSTLSFVADEIGTVVFSCETSLNIPGDLLVVQSAETSVRVKGSSIPVGPVELTTIDRTSTSVNVQWLVPEIAYTPENYTVWYGTAQNALSSASRLVEGIRDITAENQLLSTPLNGLEPDTTYFYQIEARNDVGTSLSVIEPFSTSPDALSVFISTYGNTTAGESLALTCRMTLGAGLSGIPDIEWRTSDGSLVSSDESITIEGPTVVGSFSATLTLRFSPLLASHGGQYSCLARVDGPRESKNALVTEDVTVQLPAPEVVLAQSKDGSFIEGTLLSLLCEFELHKSNDIEVEVSSLWRQSGQVIEDTGRVVVIETTRSNFESDYYTTSIVFNPLSSLYDSGIYVCEFYITSEVSSSFVLPATGLGTFNRITVQGLPPPMISVSSSSPPVVGEPYTVTCSASVVPGLIGSAVIDVHWMTEERSPITDYDSVVTLPTSVENITTTEIQFSPLHTSHGGDYICEASVFIAEIERGRDGSYLLNLVTQIPEPQITIMSPAGNIFLSGTPLVLTCDAEINYDIDTSISISIEWERNGFKINDTYRTNISETVETGNFRYQSSLVFTTLSSGDSGQYYCVVNVRAEELGTHTGSITGVRAHTFSVEDPAISISISPDSFIGLDHPPYNTLSLMCNVSKPPEVLPELQIEWLYNGILADRTSNQLTITDYNDSGNEMFSVLTFIAVNESDSGVFTCRGMIEVLDSNIIQEEVNSIITIRGPQVPVNPISFGVTVTNSTTAIFSWLIISISYTPETYYISYGYDGVINTNSTAVTGNADITSSTESFSISISDLQPFTEYSYKIVAENVIGISASSVGTFYTSSSAPTSGPSSFNASIIAATSAILTWDLPAVGSGDGIIVSYRLVCWNIYGNVIADSSISTSYNFSGLLPATQYNCSVSAFNNVGEGPPSSLTFATLEDAPEDSPIAVSVQNLSISSVLIAWSPPLIPNGVIVQYTLYIYQFDLPTLTVQIDGNTQRYTLMNLEPYQRVVVQVSASTRIGEGPLSATVEGRSAEDAISAPTVSITTNINTATAGQELFLSCRVTVGDTSLPPVQIAWLSPDGQLLSTQGRITISRESETAQLTTYSLRFEPIHTSNAGEYTCHATLYSEFGTVMESSSASRDVIVQMPPPAVSIIPLPNPVYAGINLTLVCVIDLDEPAVDTGVEIISSWSVSGAEISTDRLGILEFNDTMNALSHSTRVPLGLIALGSSDGEYTCDASITPLVNSEFILSSARLSDSVQLEANVPFLSADISPALAVALDIVPYDGLTLTCTITVPANIQIPKSLQWFRNSREVNDGSDNIMIQTNNLDGAVTISTLRSTGSSPGYYVYMCSANLVLPGGAEIQDIALGNVTVNGPSSPQEISANVANISATYAVIEWTVPFLAYTPETYVVRFGKDSLNETILVNSTLQLGAVNEMYSVTLMNLSPAVAYSVEIISTNTIGSTTPRSFTFTTSEAAPSGPPLSFNTSVVNSTTLMFSWLPPNENERNGIITSYSLLCDPSPAGYPVSVIPLSASSSDRVEVISNQFTPAVLYSCSVYASTSAGDGPAVSGMALTPDDVPAQITALTATVLSTDTIQVSWGRPNVTNGLLLLYSVAVRSVNDIVFDISVDRESLRVVLVSSLEKYMPYTVTVHAMTAAGFGEPMEIILFTEEGTPDTAPRDIEFDRINGTHMRVSWTQITLEEARGFVTGYVINYTGQGKTETVRVDSVRESITIGGLDIAQDYLVTVSAETSVGQGVESQAVIVNAPPSSFFQLRLNGVENCTNWIIQDRSLRLETITNTVVDVLENTQNCRCSVSEYYIRNQQIECSQNDVIFRAQLFSTPAATSVEMITLLQDWVSGEPFININGQALTVDTSCTVEIQSFSEDVCPPPGGQELNLQLIYIIVAVVGGVLLLALLILITFCAVRKCSQRRAKYRLRKTGDARYPTLPVTSFEMVTRPTDEVDIGPREVEPSMTFYNPGSSTPKESSEKETEMEEAGEPVRYTQVRFGFGTGSPTGDLPVSQVEYEPLQMESFGRSLSQKGSSYVSSQHESS